MPNCPAAAGSWVPARRWTWGRIAPYADLRYGHGANISQDLSLNIGYAYRF